MTVSSQRTKDSEDQWYSTRCARSNSAHPEAAMTLASLVFCWPGDPEETIAGSAPNQLVVAKSGNPCDILWSAEKLNPSKEAGSLLFIYCSLVIILGYNLGYIPEIKEFNKQVVVPLSNCSTLYRVGFGRNLRNLTETQSLDLDTVESCDSTRHGASSWRLEHSWRRFPCWLWLTAGCWFLQVVAGSQCLVNKKMLCWLC